MLKRDVNLIEQKHHKPNVETVMKRAYIGVLKFKKNMYNIVY